MTCSRINSLMRGAFQIPDSEPALYQACCASSTTASCGRALCCWPCAASTPCHSTACLEGRIWRSRRVRRRTLVNRYLVRHIIFFIITSPLNFIILQEMVCKSVLGSGPCLCHIRNIFDFVLSGEVI